MVGHSLGASVALAIAKKYNVPYDVYVNPGVSWTTDHHRHRQYFDPISMLDSGADDSMPLSFNPHGFDYAAEP